MRATTSLSAGHLNTSGRSYQQGAALAP